MQVLIWSSSGKLGAEMTFDEGLKRLGWAFLFFLGGFIFPLLWLIAALIVWAWWGEVFGKPSSSSVSSNTNSSPVADNPLVINSVARPAQPETSSDLIRSTQSEVTRTTATPVQPEATSTVARITPPNFINPNVWLEEFESDDGIIHLRRRISPAVVESPVAAISDTRGPTFREILSSSGLSEIFEALPAHSEFQSKFSPRCFYHFTDFRNLASIGEYGGLLSMREMRRRGLASIAPGGSIESQRSDSKNGMDDYVHLCFLDKNPMEFSARKDGRIGRSAFLEIEVDILQTPGLLLTPGFSNKAGVEPVDLERALKDFDFEILYGAMDWNNLDHRRRRDAAWRYEILVPREIPVEKIINWSAVIEADGSTHRNIGEFSGDNVPF